MEMNLKTERHARAGTHMYGRVHTRTYSRTHTHTHTHTHTSAYTDQLSKELNREMDMNRVDGRTRQVHDTEANGHK